MISKYHQDEILKQYESLALALREVEAAMEIIVERVRSGEQAIKKINEALRVYGLPLNQISGVALRLAQLVPTAVSQRFRHLVRAVDVEYYELLSLELRGNKSLLEIAEHDRQHLEQTFTYLAERAELANRH